LLAVLRSLFIQIQVVLFLLQQEFAVHKPSCEFPAGGETYLVHQNNYSGFWAQDVVLIFGLLASLLSSSHWHSWLLSVPALGMLCYVIATLIQGLRVFKTKLSCCPINLCVYDFGWKILLNSYSNDFFLT
jgi:hypothetical protein